MATRFLSPAQLADEWGVHVRTVTRWIKAGELRGYKLGPHTRRVAETDAADFLAKRAMDAEGFGTQNDPKSLSDDAEAGCLPKRSMHPGKQEYELES